MILAKRVSQQSLFFLNTEMVRIAMIQKGDDPAAANNRKMFLTIPEPISKVVIPKPPIARRTEKARITA